MRAMKAEKFSGYEGLKLVDLLMQMRRVETLYGVERRAEKLTSQSVNDFTHSYLSHIPNKFSCGKKSVITITHFLFQYFFSKY